MQDPNAIASSDIDIPAERPSQVLLAVRLLWASLGLGIVTSAIMRPHLPPGRETLFIQVATFALLGWLTYKIWAGRNWARITFLVLWVLGFIPAVPILLRTFGVSPLAGSINLVQSLLQIVALYLVFTNPGRSWFKPKVAVA